MLVILAIFVIWLIYWYFEYKWKFRENDPFNGPKPYPIFGNIFDLGFTPVEQLQCLSKLSQMYGPVVKFQIGPSKKYYLTTDPDLYKEILSSQKYIVKNIDYDLFIPWLGNGLLTSSGNYWQKRRKIITPAFHFKILDNFLSIFHKQSDILINKLSKVVGQNLDVYPYITSYTLDVICEAAMGISVNAQSDYQNDYVKSVKRICNIFIDRMFSPWKYFDFLFRFSSDYNEQKECLNTIHNFVNSVIEKRRQHLLNSGNETELDDEDTGVKKKMMFLDILLKANIDNESLTNEDIREEVNTFMFEGHDTTASLISFSLYVLSKHPDVQEKVLNEINEIFGNDKNYQPNVQDLNNMKYTELVLKETLRMYPPVPYFGRKVIEDFDFKGNIIPKNSTITFFVFGIHRRPELFPNPDKFNPERFNENNPDFNPFSYVPFSAGPRNCIGQKFAMYEVKSTIANIVRNFQILPPNPEYDAVLSAEIILKPINGLNIQLKPRN